MVLVSFVLFTGLVAALTYWLTRKDDHHSSSGYFLGGRRLGGVVIAGSLLLTNLSTEQMVGLNGAAYLNGFHVMAWEVIAVVALVTMALFFLPRFLKSGIATVPQFLEARFDAQTRNITTLIFLIAYAVILLPIILYSGAMGLKGIVDLRSLTGVQDEWAQVWIVVWLVGIIGSVYALFGGLRTVAVSDTLNGVGLLVGGMLIVYFGLAKLGGDGGWLAGLHTIRAEHPEMMNSVAPRTDTPGNVPFFTLFTGVLLLNLFYWTTNQQIIQRTLGARNLAEGQKGVLYCGLLKLLGPLYLVLPGIIAFHLYASEGDGLKADSAYGRLVSDVLPGPLSGFFMAVMFGAILSSYNSALNSTCTLFSLGVYRPFIRPDASDEQVVQSSKWFGWVVAIASMCAAPFLFGQASIFDYLQKMNGLYFIPIFAVVVVGMLTRRVPALAAKIGLVFAFTVIAVGYFVPWADRYVTQMHGFHFLGMVFALTCGLMLLVGKIRPRAEAWVQQASGDVDLTPWRFSKPLGVLLLVLVLAIYLTFAELSVLTG